MIRMIREYNTYENMGLIVVGISEPALRREYIDSVLGSLRGSWTTRILWMRRGKSTS